MELKIGNFVIRSSKDTIHFDLFKIKTQLSGKNEGAEFEVNTAWSIPMSRCIQHIIADKLDNDESIKDTETFLTNYKKLSDEVLEEFKVEIKKIQ